MRKLTGARRFELTILGLKSHAFDRLTLVVIKGEILIQYKALFLSAVQVASNGRSLSQNQHTAKPDVCMHEKNSGVRLCESVCSLLTEQNCKDPTW